MAHMYDEILDEVDELGRRMSSEELATLLEERGHALAPGTPGRAAWLAYAGERWELAGDLSRARACLEEAVQDGGGAYIDPRADLVHVLLELGDTSRADALIAELRRDLADGRPGDLVHGFVGESLEEHGRLEEAHRWYSAGLTYAQRVDPQAEDVDCLNGRFRVRRRLGLPHDRYDDLCEQRRRESGADLDHDVLPHSPPGQRVLTVLYWPADDFDQALGRWPGMAADCGSEHAEHRARVERTLRGLSEQGADVSVGTCHIREFLDFSEEHGAEAAEAATRAAYAAHLGRLGQVAPWPPGTNERCWCGSGAKYKKCCGALRFGAPQT